MAASRRSEVRPTTPTPVSEQVLDPPETSLLDLLDRVLDKGVMANGDITIGVAGVDLIYVRLAALLCAADRVLPPADTGTPAKRRRRSASMRPGR